MVVTCAKSRGPGDLPCKVGRQRGVAGGEAVVVAVMVGETAAGVQRPGRHVVLLDLQEIDSAPRSAASAAMPAVTAVASPGASPG